MLNNYVELHLISEMKNILEVLERKELKPIHKKIGIELMRGFIDNYSKVLEESTFKFEVFESRMNNPDIKLK